MKFHTDDAHAFRQFATPPHPRWKRRQNCAPGVTRPEAMWTSSIPSRVAQQLGMSGQDGLPAGFRDPFAPRWATPKDESSEMSCIEWAVANVLKVKYPNIHHEIMFEAARRGGYLAPDTPFDEEFTPEVQPVHPPSSTQEEERQ